MLHTFYIKRKHFINFLTAFKGSKIKIKKNQREKRGNYQKKTFTKKEQVTITICIYIELARINDFVFYNKKIMIARWEKIKDHDKRIRFVELFIQNRLFVSLGWEYIH